MCTMSGSDPARIGIMGGTFDPIHHGHLIAAEEARHAFALEQVLFVPTGDPWQKRHRAVTPAEERYLMTVIATATNPCFDVSRIEIERQGPSYTIDTLRDFHERYPVGTEFFFITGADAILQILTWKDPEDVLALATFIAATRPGHDAEDLDELSPEVRKRVEMLRIPALAISSTEIRDRVASGRSVTYLVPESVARYVEKHGLYRET
jgi:nicotinate-nucleotide adenylyltransferase